jgi:hypothetical protein
VIQGVMGLFIAVLLILRETKEEWGVNMDMYV